MQNRTLTYKTIKSAFIHHLSFSFFVMLSFLFSDENFGLFLLLFFYSTIVIFPLFSFIYLVYNVILFSKSEGLLKYYFNYIKALFITLLVPYIIETIMNLGFLTLEYFFKHYLSYVIYSFTLSVLNYFLVIKKRTK